MTITAAQPIKILAKSKDAKKIRSSSKDYKKDQPTLKELEAKKYPFPDSDLSSMLDDLLAKKIIELPESKRPREAGKITNPEYCRYHRVISHPLEKCVTLKEKIMQLAREGKIILDLGDTAETHHTSTVYETQDGPTNGELAKSPLK